MNHRHISKDGSCPRCPHCAESVNHLLFQCTFARQVWALSPFPAPPNGTWDGSLYSNMYRALNIHIYHPHIIDKSGIIPWLLWRLWKSRNDLLYKGKDYNAMETVRKAVEDAAEWSNRKEPEVRQTCQTDLNAGTERWNPPPRGWVKCNSDGARQSEGELSGVGWALRNHEGTVLWLGAKAIRRSRSVLEVELEALRWAVHTLSSFNYKKIIFESDSLEVVNLINNDECWPSFAPILQDIKLLLLNFEEVRVIYSPRGCNGVADRVAKESLSFENYVPKLYSVMPIWAKQSVMVDIPNVS